MLCVSVSVHEFTGTLIKTANILMANYCLASTILSVLPTLIHLVLTTTLGGRLYFPEFIDEKIKSKEFK